MTLSIEQIGREIQAIETKTEALAVDLQQVYGQYLQYLGESVQRQLIAVCYYICTQSFPDIFLQLSYRERSTLQADLQQVATQGAARLTLEELGKLILEEPEFDPNDLMDSGEDDREDAQSYDNLDDQDWAPESSLAAGSDLQAQDTPSSLPQTLRNPQVLWDWYSEVDNAITQVLQEISHRATGVLEKAGILENHLPEPLLEAATQSEAAEAGGGKHPNLLNFVVEMGKAREDGRKTSSQRIEIVTIHLRLTELEFGDPYLVSQRHKLRGLMQQLQNLTKSYRQRNRDQAKAEAEAAWRSSWSTL